jgi:hypothetical protein
MPCPTNKIFIRLVQKMLKSKRRLLSVILALVLTLALAVTAFAAWPSFQNKNDNNGVIDNGTPPTSTPSVTTAQLLSVNATTGVDSQSIIGNGVAYTLYNGGNDGARLQATTLSTSPTTVWNVVIDQSAINVTQLSTPYLDAANGVLYVGVTGLNGSGDYVWQLYAVTNLTSNPPTVTAAVNANGNGQFSTPISAAEETNPTYIYFGSYTGARKGLYYQYGISTAPGTLTTYTPPSGDDFYWAGAAFVNIAQEGFDDCVVFGSENPYLYVRPVSAFGDPSMGNVVRLINLINNPGAVRSSIVTYSQVEDTESVNYIIFSSAGGRTGTLWQVPQANLTTTDTGDYNITTGYLTSVTTTSTPVVSTNNIIYLGGYNGDGTGAVWAFYPGNATISPMPFDGSSKYTPNPLYPLAGSTSPGDEVSGSVIVYSTTADEDYIYFTTNSASNGQGYCYYFDVTDPSSVIQRWSVGGTSGNRAALQGFAADNGYLIYGDEGNRLYICIKAQHKI